MAEHDAATADESEIGQSSPASPTSEPSDPSGQRQLAALGVPMEKARLDSGLSTDAFLRAHGLDRRTWRRLLYGLPSANDVPPRDDTVLRYGRAVGLSDAAAMRLADETFSPNTEDLTALGSILEPIRRRAGESMRTFVEKRGLAYTTYKRLIRRNLYHYHASHYRASQTTADGWPPPATVRKYASAAGVPLELAERLAEQDRRARLDAAPSAPDSRREAPGQSGDSGLSDTTNPQK